MRIGDGNRNAYLVPVVSTDFPAFSHQVSEDSSLCQTILPRTASLCPPRLACIVLLDSSRDIVGQPNIKLSLAILR